MRLFYAAGLLMVLGAVAHVAYGFFVTSSYFRLNQVQVEGVPERIQRELQSLVNSAIDKNKNLLAMDLSDIRKQIASHPRVRNLRLEKVYPNTLLIKAAEREPAAIVYAENFYLVDRDGFTVSQLRNQDLASQDYPLITGLSGDEVAVGEKIHNPRLHTALDLSRVLKEKNAELYARVSEIHLGTDPVQHCDSLKMTLKGGGLEVRFGDGNAVEKLPALEFFLQQQLEQKVDPYREMAYVDLRFANQIVFMDRSTVESLASGTYEKQREEQEAMLDQAKKQAEEPEQEDVIAGDEPKKPSERKPDVARKREQQPAADGVSEERRVNWPEPLGVQRAASPAPPTRRAPAQPMPVQQNVEEQKRPGLIRRGLSKVAFWKNTDQPQQAPQLYPPPSGAQ